MQGGVAQGIDAGGKPRSFRTDPQGRMELAEDPNDAGADLVLHMRELIRVIYNLNLTICERFGGMPPDPPRVSGL